MDNQQKTIGQMVQENVEREVRILIGDLYIQIIQLKLMLQMQQQEPAPNPQPAPQPPVPNPQPVPPQPEGDPPLDRPEKRGNGRAREVAS